VARVDRHHNSKLPANTNASERGYDFQFAIARRILVNGSDPSILSKKKRSVLLFHHTVANAPVH